MADAKRPEGLQVVEILHIDTEGSQKFFQDVNPAEKSNCQGLLFNLFSECCQRAEGFVAPNWQGDGGHAYFPARFTPGNSILAAQDFLSKLSVLAQQTATTLGRRMTPTQAFRNFRVKAHFGNVFLGSDAGVDAGPSKDFDSFLKYERELGPIANEIFITEQLRAQLSGAQKDMFERHKESAVYGALTTELFRMKAQPSPHTRNLLQEETPKDITLGEWSYLRRQILSQKLNVVARNSITVGLIKRAPEMGGRMGKDVLTDLTLRALYNYLRTVYPYFNFRVALWRPGGENCLELEKVAAYPPPASTGRRVKVGDTQFQVVRTFLTAAPAVTECVKEARLKSEWVDFDPNQADPARGLQSTIQFPIYRTKNAIGEHLDRETMAVLSVDSNKPDLFMKEELDLWIEDFVGFLANLALAEQLN
jgi:hypothetical protein